MSFNIYKSTKRTIMSKKFILTAFIFVISFTAACQQQNPTPIESTYQPRDTNRPAANHNETKHGNSAGNSANHETTETNTMNANTSMMNANMTNQTEMKPESRTNSGR
jgi:hypothetical protein